MDGADARVSPRKVRRVHHVDQVAGAAVARGEAHPVLRLVHPPEAEVVRHQLDGAFGVADGEGGVVEAPDGVLGGGGAVVASTRVA